jgi:serine/threonine protein kinase
MSLKNNTKSQFKPNLPPGYLLIKKIGSDQSEPIYLARTPDQYAVVIKEYKNQIDSKTAEKMTNEVYLYANIDSDDLLKYINSYYDSNQLKFYLIMENTDGYTLSQFQPNNYLFSQKINYVYQLIVGLFVLHLNYDLSHGQIKPSNVMIDRPEITVRHFGYALTFNANFWKQCYDLPDESIYYRSPENIVIQEDQLTEKILRVGDIWSLGVLIYWILTGKQAFESTNFNDFESITQTILTSEPNYAYLPLECINSPSFQKMIRGMLIKDFENRFTILDVLDLITLANTEF